MRKRIRWTTAMVATAALASPGLAGCGGSHASQASFPTCLAPGQAVAVAIGARANTPQPTVSTDVQAAMNSALAAHQDISLIRLDGRPQVVFRQAFTGGDNGQTTQVAKNNYITGLNDALDGTQQQATDIRAQAPQADVLDALAMAASNVPPGGNVIVMDSGLQTTAPLNYTTGLLSDDPASIVNFLSQQHELPNLSGRHVYFIGLGWTAPPQASLAVNYRNKITQLWLMLARAAHASCAYASPTSPDKAASVPDRPAVTVVQPPPVPQPPGSCSTTNLGDSDHVGFDYDSTTFRDPAGARVTLQKLASVMLKTGESLKLTGSTSSDGSDQYNLRLSLRRAEAVKQVLTQMNAPASRITTYGDGSHLPGRVNDRGPNGQLLLGPAIEDRKVVAKLYGASCSRS